LRQSQVVLGQIVLVLIIFASVLPSHGMSTTQFLSSQGFPPSSKNYSVLVESSHDLSETELSSLGRFGGISTVAGSVAVLNTQLTALASIERLPFVIRVEPSHPLHVYLDNSVPDIGANAVWNNVKDSYGLNVTGNGVIIGFVDTGIDITHRDFTFPNGTTKILYVWDQTTSGRPPDGFSYGIECTKVDIETGTCPEFDSFGHGTHVAGIAAGSGRATGNFTGVAPGASIIFVKSGFSVCEGSGWNFYSDQILDGINYITKKAKQLGMRAVVSLSLGGNIGAHDGTDPMEQALDAFVEAGTPIAVAAGNSAMDNDHVHGQLAEGSNVTVGIEVKPTTSDLQIDVWFSPHDQFAASLESPDGGSFSIPTPPGGATSKFGNITGMANPSWARSSLGNEVYMEVNSTLALPPTGWSVTLKALKVGSTGSWDAWIDTVGCSSPGAVFLPGPGYEIDPHDTIGIPGTAQEVVTVGAYITKTAWRGISGQIVGSESQAVGGIAPFSSLGPTRDGRIKPDVVAPGLYIASARSNLIPVSANDPDLFHRINAGTSMATPHVAGVIALMLQYRPNLQAKMIPAILRSTARLDLTTGLSLNGSLTWGFGKVDARTATGFYRVTLIPNGIIQQSTVTLGHVDANKTFTIEAPTWTDIYFSIGTTHMVSFDRFAQGLTGTRYELETGNFTVDASKLVNLTYTPEYLLNVDSEYGPTSGSGWYRAHSTAVFDAPKRVPASGFLGLIEAEYVLAYWVTDTGKLTQNSITMDRPTTVTSVYVLSFSLQMIAVLIVGMMVLTVLIVVIVVRKRRTARS
jgi:subtilisin family serine protease